MHMLCEGSKREAKKVVRNLGWVKIPFYPRDTSCSLRPTDPLLNNWFKVQPINLNPSRANEKVGSLIQDLDSVLKGTTYLLSQKWVGVNSVLHPMSLCNLSTIPDLRILPNEQRFIVSSGL
ncbi:hypothetical protein E6C27_scaffold60G001950 [Cucumis melo var. makuwa]|uniref:Uncharacterized protein n=1 Tax=Cucumis melo var. makuwa TaxID=1194695 RepID=A0A5A7U922_CUCMM|nr:hypothetical protein E6C27_scaffold60G001950 [Cucumis melo var. makuwa]